MQSVLMCVGCARGEQRVRDHGATSTTAMIMHRWARSAGSRRRNSHGTAHVKGLRATSRSPRDGVLG